MVADRFNIIGKHFGYFTVIDYIKREGKNTYWLVRCVCGNEKVLPRSNFVGGNTKSCGCMTGQLMTNARRQEYGLASKTALYKVYKSGAKTRNLSWEITFEQFIDTCVKNCRYCGIVPSNYYSAPGCYGGFNYNGLDRVDNTKGYTIENIVPCCRYCNYAKRDMTAEEFISWVSRVSRNLFSI